MNGDRLTREQTDAANDRGKNLDQTREAGILADEISDAASEAVGLELTIKHSPRR